MEDSQELFRCSLDSFVIASLLPEIALAMATNLVSDGFFFPKRSKVSVPLTLSKLLQGSR